METYLQRKKPSAIVIGVGAQDGLGAAVARRFAREGWYVYVVGRAQQKLDQVVEAIGAQGGSAEATAMDATVAEDVRRLFTRAFAATTGHDAPSVIVFNAGDNARIPLIELTAAQFEDFWRVGCYAGFLAAREAARALLPLGRGTVIFTGASASLRGRANYAHFAVAKAGLRMLSQSMAREFGPRGIHAAHVVIDGGIDGEHLRKLMPEFVEQSGEEGLLDADAIAETYWQLHLQPRSAWTQEIDLRPFKEIF